MKQIFLSLLVFASMFATAQKNKKDCMPEGGFWVVESNIKTPKESIVFFYTTGQALIYKEVVSGRRLNVNRKKIVRNLNAVLLQSITAWEKEKILRQDMQLVMSRR